MADIIVEDMSKCRRHYFGVDREREGKPDLCTSCAHLKCPPNAHYISLPTWESKCKCDLFFERKGSHHTCRCMVHASAEEIKNDICKFYKENKKDESPE